MTPEREKEIGAKVRQVFKENGGALTLHQCTRLVMQAEILTTTEMHEGSVDVIAAAGTRAATRLGMTGPDLLIAAFVDRDPAARAVLWDEIQRDGEDEP